MNNQSYALGLEWLPMLMLYSNIGKKNTSQDERRELGEQLRKLDGKHERVIENINNNIDSLIRNSSLKLSKDDMEDLKSRIVSKLGEVASSRECESDPVVCTSQNIVFDEAAKQVLRQVVKEEIGGVSPGSHNDSDVREAIANLSRTTSEGFRKLEGLIGTPHGPGDQETKQEMIPEPEQYNTELYEMGLEEVKELFINGDTRLDINCSEDDGKTQYKIARAISFYRTATIINLNESVEKKTIEHLVQQRITKMKEKWVKEIDDRRKDSPAMLPFLGTDSHRKAEDYAGKVTAAAEAMMQSLTQYIPIQLLPIDILRYLHSKINLHIKKNPLR